MAARSSTRWAAVACCLAFACVVVSAQPNLFGRLGLSHGASEQDVKKAYKKLVRTLHPDAVPVAERESARIRFREVTEAYEILSDPTKRAQFESGRRPESSGDNRQYLRYNLFTQDFDGVELRDTEAEKLLQPNSKHDTHIVFFWSSNFPDCIDEAPAFKLLAAKLRGTSVTVASYKCDDNPMVCRRLGLPSLPAIRMFWKGQIVDYNGKSEIVALTSFAAKYLTTGVAVRNSSVVAMLESCPNPTPSLKKYGIAGSYFWPTTKRSHLGVMDFGLVALEFSPCFDCETALHLALETVSAVLPDLQVRRVDCRRHMNKDFCDIYRVKDRAWTLATIRRSCWYATKKPFEFSDENCEALSVAPFTEKYSNEHLVNFIVSSSSNLAGARLLSASAFDSIKKTNDSWAVLFDDSEALDSTSRVQWFLLGRSVNKIKPVLNPKGFRLRIGIVNCRKTPSACLYAQQRPFVALFGYGTKVKATEPIFYPKITGWKAMVKDFVKDADPLHLHVLTPKTYDKKINAGLQKGKAWFVLFNAGQWCPPCNQIRGPWKEATRIVQQSKERKKLSFATVECDTHKQLCNKLGIGNYPTMAFIAKGRPRTEYNGARDGHEIAKWGIDQLDSRLQQNVHPGELQQRVQSGESLVVAFTAGAWCPPCTALGPVLKRASNLITKATCVSFNCDDNPQFCNHFGVEGYPTVILFSKGQRHQYQAYGKTDQQLAAWANQLL